MQKNKSKLIGGFTLIEIMVALTVFMAVMTIALSAFLNIMDIQKKTEAFRKVNDNLNFAMEAMMREIREGKGYSVIFGGDGLSFTVKDENGDYVTITYSSIITANEGYLQRKKGTDDALRMTSDGIKITRLSFSVKGNVAGDNQQPLATISIGGESGEKAKLKSSLNLQATVSQRKLDSQ